VKGTGRALRQALVLGALAVLVAAAVHLPLVKRFARGEFRETFFEASKYPGIRMITLAEAEELWRTGLAVILDARAGESFERGHIPGSRNVPAPEAGGTIPADLLGAARNMVFVVYCEGGDCQSSLALARRLHDEGFRDLRVFEGGWAEWTKEGLPEEKSGKAGEDDGQE
jgi:rhodanese-related sulfurtransferase